ncbi:MAG: NfeD family protein [Bacteroidaceae bacterium]|nr:NfeD family protein [Bacteroidaceae bacterium]
MEVTNFFTQLDPTMRFFWGVAIASSFVFLLQMALTFLGIGDTDSDFDFQTDVDATAGDTLDVGGAMQLFSVRNVVNFLLGLGWGGVCFSTVFTNRILLGIAALASGVCFVAIFVFLFRKMRKLESNGAFQIADCVGQVCDVYLRIPAERGGQGKVQVSFGGSVQELAAVTDGEALPSGAKVRIVELVDEHTVLVALAE